MIPSGLGKLLGKLQAMRNPQFTNRELGALAHGETEKLVPWAMQELQKPFSQPMSRRGFFGAVGSIPAKAKKMERFLAVPDYLQGKAEADALERLADRHEWDPGHAWAERLEYRNDPEALAAFDANLKSDFDSFNNALEQKSAVEEAIGQDGRFQDLFDAVGVKQDDMGGLPDINHGARHQLRWNRFETPNPFPHPYDIPRDTPNRPEMIRQWQDVDDGARKTQDASFDALQQALKGEFDAIQVEDLLDPPGPAPAPAPPPAPEAPQAPQGPSMIDRYKQRFRIR